MRKQDIEQNIQIVKLLNKKVAMILEDKGSEKVIVKTDNLLYDIKNNKLCIDTIIPTCIDNKEIQTYETPDNFLNKVFNLCSDEVQINKNNVFKKIIKIYEKEYCQ